MRVPRGDAQVTSRPSGTRRAGSAGRSPQARRSSPSRTTRTRASHPQRTTTRPKRDPQTRRGQLPVRASVLAIAIVSVTLTLALPFKNWLAERDAISSLQASNVAAQHRVAELKLERKEWTTPSFIEHQATLRLHYVKPGQSLYIGIGDHPHAKAKSQATSEVNSNKPWYSQLWSTAQSAGVSPTSTSRHK